MCLIMLDGSEINLLQMLMNVWLTTETAVIPVLMTFLGITVNVMAMTYYTQMDLLVYQMQTVLVTLKCFIVIVYLDMRILPLKKASTALVGSCLLYTSPSPRDATLSRMPSSA